MAPAAKKRAGKPKGTRKRAKPQAPLDVPPIKGAEFKPTDDHRKIVMLGAGIGFTREQIARLVTTGDYPLGISVDQLAYWFRDELDTGADRINAQVAGNLFKLATGAGKEAVTAAIFWMKTRMKWREREAAGEAKVSLPNGLGADGQPVEFTIKIGEAGGDSDGAG